MEPTDTTIYKPRNRFNSRVEDWLNRINLLYAQIENWVNDYKNYACIKNRQITMHEQLMKSHHIPAENIDILDVILNEKINISFVPFGLWILGANGRFDVVAEKKTWQLIDKSKPFEAIQEWTLISRSLKNIEIKFNQEAFRNLLDTVR